MGSGRLCSEGEVNNTHACLSLCLPPFLPLSINCLCSLRLSGFGISAPRPFPPPSPMGPPARPAGHSRRPHLQGFPDPQPRTPRRSPAATCRDSASACSAWRPLRKTPARPRAPSSSPRCTVTCAPSRPGRNRENPGPPRRAYRWTPPPQRPAPRSTSAPSSQGPPPARAARGPRPCSPRPVIPARRPPHRTAAAAAASQTRRGAQSPAAPAARFLETLALSFEVGVGAGLGEGWGPSPRAAEGPGRPGEVLGRAAEHERRARVRCGLY